MRPGPSKSTWIKLRPWQRLHAATTRRSISTEVVPRMSTVHQGTAFEERSLAMLHKTMSMSLKRVGGREDGGIDLLGWWWLPATDNNNNSLLNDDDHDIPPTTTSSSSSSSSSSSHPPPPPSSSNRRRIRVIGQCKAEKKKLGPKFVRELEGVLFRFLTMSAPGGSLDFQNSSNKPPDPEFFTNPDNNNNNNTSSSSSSQHHHHHQQHQQQQQQQQQQQLPIVALLMSESEFTKSAILRANSSPIPFFLLHLPAVDHSNPTAAAEADGLGDLGMALCNPALCGRDGLLKGHMELRWERRGSEGRGRPAVWWGNQKLHSWTPELVTSKLDDVGDSTPPSTLA